MGDECEVLVGEGEIEGSTMLTCASPRSFRRTSKRRAPPPLLTVPLLLPPSSATASLLLLSLPSSNKFSCRSLVWPAAPGFFFLTVVTEIVVRGIEDALLLPRNAADTGKLDSCTRCPAALAPPVLSPPAAFAFRASILALSAAARRRSHTEKQHQRQHTKALMRVRPMNRNRIT